MKTHEKLNYDATPEWKNVTDEQIDDVIKAEAMAHVEDKWRNAAAVTMRMARNQNNSTDIFTPIIAPDTHGDSVHIMSKKGPEAVQEVADVYDRGGEHNPKLPSQGLLDYFSPENEDNLAEHQRNER